MKLNLSVPLLLAAPGLHTGHTPIPRQCGNPPEVAAELDRLIRSARSESPVAKFNFPALK